MNRRPRKGQHQYTIPGEPLQVLPPRPGAAREKNFSPGPEKVRAPADNTVEADRAAPGQARRP